jgi:tripartite-type tricarboxylate transporter receptor subunit TctC
MKYLLQFTSLILSIVLSAPAMAADYPVRPITVVLSTSPGGGADVTMRLIAPRLAKRLGQNVVVDNKPGASGMIAAAHVARSAPDGYTLLVDITSFAVNPALHKDMQYRPLEDLVPITQIVRGANVLIVNPKVPVTTVAEFVAYAKKQDGALTYASSGPGTAQHLAMEVFQRQAGIKLVHVPYKGGGAALADLLAGHVQASFAFVPTVAEQVKKGTLRALATTGEKRSDLLGDLPTIAQSGFPGFQSYDWNGMFAPAATPVDIVARVQREMKAVLDDPEVQARLKTLGLEPVGSTSAEFRAFLVDQIERSKDIVKQANIVVN